MLGNKDIKSISEAYVRMKTEARGPVKTESYDPKKLKEDFIVKWKMPRGNYDKMAEKAYELGMDHDLYDLGVDDKGNVEATFETKNDAMRYVNTIKKRGSDIVDSKPTIEED